MTNWVILNLCIIKGSIEKMKRSGWRDGSVVKGPQHSCRRPGLVPSTQIECFTTTCNSSSGGSESLFCLPWACMHTVHIQTLRNTHEIKINVLREERKVDTKCICSESRCGAASKRPHWALSHKHPHWALSHAIDLSTLWAEAGGSLSCRLSWSTE